MLFTKLKQVGRLILLSLAVALNGFLTSGCAALQEEWQRGEKANVDWNATLGNNAVYGDKWMSDW